MNKFVAIALFALVGAPACMDAADEPTTGEADQEVGGRTLTTHTCGSATSCSYDLGSWATQTCFLAGIEGDMGDSGGFPVFQSNDAGVERVCNAGTSCYYPSDFDNYLVINNANSSSNLRVTVGCVNSVANRTENVWYGDPSQPLKVPATSGRRCFLSDVTVYQDALIHGPDLISITNSGGYFVLNGSFYDPLAEAAASLVCLDIGTDEGTWAYNNGTTSPASGSLASDSTNNVMCGLTAVGGILTTVGQGIEVSYAPYQWSWSVKSHSQFAAQCFK
ncbi:MAG TPA: hypothetical protein VGM88_30925 [Kofleriaceae bacterium]|jgi:hypothetical protein